MKLQKKELSKAQAIELKIAVSFPIDGLGTGFSPEKKELFCLYERLLKARMKFEKGGK